MKTWLSTILALCLLALSVSAQDEKLPVDPLGVYRSRNGLELPNEIEPKKVLEADNDIIHTVISSSVEAAEVPLGNLEAQTTEEYIPSSAELLLEDERVKVLEQDDDFFYPMKSSEEDDEPVKRQRATPSTTRPVLPKRNTSGPKLMYCWSPSGHFICMPNSPTVTEGTTISPVTSSTQTQVPERRPALLRRYRRSIQSNDVKQQADILSTIAPSVLPKRNTSGPKLLYCWSPNGHFICMPNRPTATEGVIVYEEASSTPTPTHNLQIAPAVLPKRTTSGPKLMYCWSPSGHFMCGLNGRK